MSEVNIGSKYGLRELQMNTEGRKMAIIRIPQLKSIHALYMDIQVVVSPMWQCFLFSRYVYCKVEFDEVETNCITSMDSHTVETIKTWLKVRQ